MRDLRHKARAVLFTAILASCAAAAAASPPAPLKQVPAPIHAYASSEMILAATRAGQRLVAVGDHGVVLLSDDDGRSYRQARAVPTSATLTAVSFSDARNGWAVGHLGVILHTSDGGETWVLQRSDTSVDQPLFSVYFTDAEHGVAAGLWSLLLITADGGHVWKPVVLQPPPGSKHADRNLFAIFSNHKGSLFIAAERGAVLRSDDQGASWSYLNTGARGSFWTGCALKDGTLLVAGLRGHVYRSTDDGQTWNAVPSGTMNSITDIIDDGGQVAAVGLDGVELRSRDGGLTFGVKQRDDRLALTAVLAASNGALHLFSVAGVVNP
ncbi:MAG TPA: YCF48-related protein [Burkholderiales bacterium]|nr:YCF48-related protein [Burkholderiales bacterium]